MNTRRYFLRHCMTGGSALALGGLLAGCGGGADGGLETGPVAPPPPINSGAGAQQADGWRMPDEAEAHKATWMAYGASSAVWTRAQVPQVQLALVRIANAIAAYEPVNMLVRPDELASARPFFDARVNLIPAEMDDVWMRDTGPVFVRKPNGERAGVKFNFNGWGNKQQSGKDGQVADVVAAQARVPLLATRLVLEGGALEVDGKGTAIIAESCVLNNNRNPGWSKADCEAELLRLLGIRKVIWLPGIKNQDITDAHTDFYARFVRPGVVAAHREMDPESYDYALTRRHLEILRGATDADGQPLQIVVIDGPEKIRPGNNPNTFAAGYINYYATSSAIFLPEFGDAQADASARAQYAQLYPGRAVIQINIDPIAAGGGGIHCTTQQEIA
ncbi:agmatine/peptidylarginine deiminase [Janthinobacterium lividum]|uniref:agmatine deiminase family protein n=1 Tax=Janthinobacterium lividum TaxID=29581 RepID=UPI000893C336|nr:agmatine deiminase family protein [Janthinobacterium lividum]MCC7713053.1 agmatine deiminase family protein [Janthinobacterium lividum]OEZ57427.1 putative agmatine deiminase [Janthinobacterium lividum]WQE31487.1 agmatine deiminase family protein [Janthinobacterium lividum]STQ97015.1 Putative agmatine deiminase [Janthinobacterium lividum]